MEIFKEVLGYEGLYQVSNLGNVKSLRFGKEKILKAGLDGTKYLTVAVCRDGIPKTKKVHQLVAESFLGHSTCGYELVVNHINFNRIDNRACNLELISQRDNTNSKHIKSTSNYTGVSWYKVNKKWVAKIKIKGKTKHLGYFTNEIDASKSYNAALKEMVF
jgi:hypothetical protein